MDTGAGFNLIRRNVLTFGWVNNVDNLSKAPGINEANRNPLRLGEVVALPKGFRNTLFKVQFIIDEKLVVDAIFGTSFMNRQVEIFLFRNQKMKFSKGGEPVVGQGTQRPEVPSKTKEGFLF